MAGKERGAAAPRLRSYRTSAVRLRSLTPDNGYLIADTCLGQIPQILPRFEADRVSRRNRDFDAGLRIAADSPLAPLDLENSEASKLDAISGAEGGAHRLDDGLDRGRRLRARDLREVDDEVDDVRFDHFPSGMSPHYISETTRLGASSADFGFPVHIPGRVLHSARA